ncbi:hypothetical protein P152DRAFT_89088 [Eremomyces bilateralis CBS 781.70]|uniref:Uncharacterized protein n=1 Tax=Eremomyces bilateralis CBS 781.70 TaxID=1392243 RepID=A0A6G1FY17_9PEZI|nr:uncharacterized protein P152DRAFT_89088 [Eremomyces bilateralis CBS 781.70]KAF1810566.1 hypothetical protein P152DRAFT_89088 [Eremomyces bilateralis CBS 781.70]
MIITCEDEDKSMINPRLDVYHGTEKLAVPIIRKANKKINKNLGPLSSSLQYHALISSSISSISSSSTKFRCYCVPSLFSAVGPSGFVVPRPHQVHGNAFGITKLRRWHSLRRPTRPSHSQRTVIVWDTPSPGHRDPVSGAICGDDERHIRPWCSIGPHYPNSGSATLNSRRMIRAIVLDGPIVTKQ